MPLPSSPSPAPPSAPTVPLRINHSLSFLVLRLVDGLLMLVPLETAFRLGGLLGRIAYYFFARRRAVALSNLQLAFGREKSTEELRELNRDHFGLLGANLLAALKMANLPEEEIWARVSISVPPDRIASGWIALISHIGNWELFSHLGSRFPEYRFGAVYRGFLNPFLDLQFQRARERFGVTLFERRTELLKCVQFLRGGGVLGVLADQGAGYAGLWTPLFGKLTSTSTLAPTLSTRTKLPLVPIAIYTTGLARWRLVASEPVYPNERETEELTAEINRQLEEQIRRAPADWLWSHDRWKPLRPHFLFARDQRRTFFPPGCDRENVEPFRLLAVSPPSDQDARATFKAVRAIKQGRPDNWLAVLAPTHLAELWHKVAEVDHVFVPTQHSTRGIAAAIRATAKFDAAITFEHDWRTALALWLVRIPIRVGRTGSLASFFYNQHPHSPRRHRNRERAHLRTAQSVGASINEYLSENAPSG